jgi:aldehyde:ferredoxin oxidoreductase
MVETGRPLEELGIPTLERFSSEGKAALVAKHQDWRTFNNALVQCYFPNPPAKDFCEMVASASGLDVGMDNVLEYGERIWNLKRALNLKLGYQARRSEVLPALLVRPLEEGGSEGHVPEFGKMMEDYYSHRDWDWATGRRSRRKMSDLGQGEIARDLWGDV